MQGHMIFKRKRFIFCIQKKHQDSIHFQDLLIGPSCGGHGLRQLTGAKGSPAMIFKDFHGFSRFCRQNQRIFTKILQKIYEINVEEKGNMFSLFAMPKLYGFRCIFCVGRRCVCEEIQYRFLKDLLKKSCTNLLDLRLKNVLWVSKLLYCDTLQKSKFYQNVSIFFESFEQVVHMFLCTEISKLQD